MEFNELTGQEKEIILKKGTEKPFSGQYDNFFREGVYLCRRCNAPLYLSDSKFDAGCGWPAFDDEIRGAVKRLPDSDGARIEIQCAKCGAHLGHVFSGEKLTPKNVRQCVNSISIKFVPETESQLESIVFGGGCFWCLEAVFSRMKGVAKVIPGYAGGNTANPLYEEVCSGKTGHAEVVKVMFDQSVLPLEGLLDLFFEMHDPTTKDRQGNDVGSQYRSIILCTSEEQLEKVGKLVKGHSKDYAKPIVTDVKRLDVFHPAEEKHQRYYEKNKLQPYCVLVISPKLKKLKERYGLAEAILL